MKSSYRKLAALVLIASAAMFLGWVAAAGAFHLNINRNKNGTITLKWDSQPGWQYQVLWSSNLTTQAGSWMTLDQITATNPISEYVDEGGPGRAFPLLDARRFYRVSETPGANPNPIPTIIAEDISTFTRWNLAGSPYLITKDVRILASAGLTIDAGVEVQFQNNTRLIVDGILQVQGDPLFPAVFTSADYVPWPGDWQGIEFSNSSEDDTCVLSNAIVEYARKGVACRDASPRILGCHIRFCSEQGIYLERSSPLIEGNEIDRNNYDGIYAIDNSSPRILRNKIWANSSDGVELYSNGSQDRNCRPVLQGNQIIENRDYALRAYNYFRPSETIIEARSNWWGTVNYSELSARIYDFADSTYSPVVNYGNCLDKPGGQGVPGTFIGGALPSDQTWKVADLPIRVLCPLVIPSNIVLRVEPGVTVEFMGNYRLEVNGTLDAQGTEASPVRFTGGDLAPWPGDWEGIRFNGSSVNSVLSNAVVEYARRGVSCYDSSPRLSGCQIHHCNEHGIYLERSSPAIQNNRIHHNNQDGIYAIDKSSPNILGNRIWANGYYGIELYGDSSKDRNSLPLINGNQIYENRYDALRAYNFYLPRNTVINARSNWWGTVSPVEISDTIYDYADSNYAPLVDYGNWLNQMNGVGVAGTFVYGAVTNSVVWRAADSPYGVLGSFEVETNGTLTIEPGVVVNIYGSTLFEISGTLRALGAANNMIRFTSGQLSPKKGDWQGIRFSDTSVDASCVLSNVVVEYARKGIRSYDASPALYGCRIQQCSEEGIYLERSSPIIRESVIETNGYDGIYCFDRSSPEILSCRIQGNQGDGIELYGSTSQDKNNLPVIHLSQCMNNQGYALRTSSYYQATNVVINARSNWWGSASATDIAARIYDQADTTSSPYVDYGNWFGSESGVPLDGTFVIRPITTNTTWRLADSPVHLCDDVSILSGATLTIEPGVLIRCLGNYLLDVSGGLKALGAPTNKVVFTSGQLEPRKNDWLGIRFNDTSLDAVCVLSNAVVEYAKNGVQCIKASPAITRSQLRRNETGIRLEECASPITFNLIEFNDTGIYCYLNASPTLQGNTITANRYNGLELRGSGSQNKNPLPVLSGNGLFGNSTEGTSWYNLYAYDFYQPALVTLDAIGTWWASTDTNLIERSVYHRKDSSYSPTVNYSQPASADINYTVFGLKSVPFWISPNADGTNDSLVNEAQLSKTANWSVMLANSFGQTVRRFSGSGTVISNAWDGKDDLGNLAPEGKYRVIVTASQQASSELTASYGDFCYLDRTAPLIQVTATALSDGKLANVVDFSGSATDALFKYYALEYGSGANPTVFRTLASNTVPAMNLLLTPFNTQTITNGNYLFRFRAVDLAGNQTVTQWVGQVDNLSLSKVSITNRFFDPLSKSTLVSFDLNKAGDVVLKIVPLIATADFMGSMTLTFRTNPVFKTTQRLNAGPQQLAWNGRNTSGALETNGLFAVILEATGDSGRFAQYDPEYVTGPVTVSNISVSKNFNFQANEPMAVAYTLFAPAFVFVAVPNNNYPVVWGEPRDAGPYTDYWNGRSSLDRSLIYGQFSMAIKTQILPENAVVIRYPKDLIIADLRSESYVFAPHLSGISEIRYHLNLAAQAELKVRDPNGNMIMLMAKTLKPAGSYAVEWNGNFDASSLVNQAGDYEIYLRATDPNTGITEQKTANITVRK